MALPWFKFFHEFAGDPKVQGMPEHMQRRLVMLFCYHAQGTLELLDDDQLARNMGITRKDLAETKAIFSRMGFINGTWIPRNWKRRQEYDATIAKRMHDYRERKRNTDRNGAVTPTVTEAQQDPNTARIPSRVQITDFRGEELRPPVTGHEGADPCPPTPSTPDPDPIQPHAQRSGKNQRPGRVAQEILERKRRERQGGANP